MSYEREAREVVGRFGRALAAVDVKRLASLWDDDYAFPVFQPEERLAPLLSWDAVEAHIMHLPEVIKGVSDIRPLDFRLDVLGEVAVAYARVDAALHFVRENASLKGEVRQTLILRRRDGEWRVIHYHESRLTPGLEELVT
jgi:ketosteroid isomerase-like protein